MNHSLQLHPAKWARNFYQFCIGAYLLHMAIMAHLTSFFPDVLMRFRMPSFALVAALAMLAVGSKLLTRGIPIRVLIFYGAFLSIFMLSFLYSGENVPYVTEILFSGNFIKYVLIFSALFMVEEDPHTRNCQLTVIAAITLCVFQLGVLTGDFLNEKEQLEYMTIGYGCAPWWIILAQGVFYHRNKWIKLLCFLGAAYFAVFIAIYGNRGALLILAVALLVMMIVYVPLNKLVLLAMVVGAGLLAAVTQFAVIFEKIAQLFGINYQSSRTLRILTNGLGFFYDSGRFPLWEDCFGGILEHPLIGNGLGADRLLTSDNSYAHNIVIELCVALGVIGGLLVYGWLLYIGVRMIFRCKDRSWQALFLPFYLYSMLQLLLSGTFMESGYLVASAVIYLTCVTWHKEFFIHTNRKEQSIAIQAEPKRSFPTCAE